jgi:hypothetical protein
MLNQLVSSMRTRDGHDPAGSPVSVRAAATIAVPRPGLSAPVSCR